MKAITLLLCLSIKFASGQIDTVNQPLKFAEVIYTDSVKANQLYERGRLWFAQTFNNSKAVLQIDDKQSGELVGKAKIRYNSSIFVGSVVTGGYISYNLKLYVKDGRYKYEISDFVHEGTDASSHQAENFGLITNSDTCPITSNQGWRNRVWKDIKDVITSNMPAIISSLKDAMTKPTPASQDW